MNNVDESQDEIWGTDEAARNNTADLVMFALYVGADNPSMTLDLVAAIMVFRALIHVQFGVGQATLGFTSLSRVIDVLDAHGLLDSCA